MRLYIKCISDYIRFQYVCVKLELDGYMSCGCVAGGADAPAPVGGRRRARGAYSALVWAREERTDHAHALGADRRRHGTSRNHHRQVPHVNGPLEPAVTLTSPLKYRCYTAPDASLSHKAAYFFHSDLSKASVMPYLCSFKICRHLISVILIYHLANLTTKPQPFTVFIQSHIYL